MFNTKEVVPECREEKLFRRPRLPDHPWRRAGRHRTAHTALDTRACPRRRSDQRVWSSAPDGPFLFSTTLSCHQESLLRGCSRQAIARCASQRAKLRCQQSSSLHEAVILCSSLSVRAVVTNAFSRLHRIGMLHEAIQPCCTRQLAARRTFLLAHARHAMRGGLSAASQMSDHATTVRSPVCVSALVSFIGARQRGSFAACGHDGMPRLMCRRGGGRSACCG